MSHLAGIAVFISSCFAGTFKWRHGKSMNITTWSPLLIGKSSHSWPIFNNCLSIRGLTVCFSALSTVPTATWRGNRMQPVALHGAGDSGDGRCLGQLGRFLKIGDHWGQHEKSLTNQAKTTSQCQILLARILGRYPPVHPETPGRSYPVQILVVTFPVPSGKRLQ